MTHIRNVGEKLVKSEAKSVYIKYDTFKISLQLHPDILQFIHYTALTWTKTTH